MLTIDVCGTLYYVRATQFPEKIPVSWRHVECRENALIGRMPRAKSTDGEAKDRASLVQQLKVGFQVFVFEFFPCDGFLQGLLAIVEGTADINDSYVVLIIDDNVGADG